MQFRMADPSGLAFSMPPPQENNTNSNNNNNNGRFARLSAIQASMRSHLNPFTTSSSLYSQSPDPNNISTVNGPATTPKPAFRFFGRWGETTAASESMLNLSLHPQPVPATYSPARLPSEWAQEHRTPSEPDRLFVLDSRRETRIASGLGVPGLGEPGLGVPGLGEPGLGAAELVEETGANVDLEAGTARPHRRHHRKHRRRRQEGSWTRGHRFGTVRRGSHPLHGAAQTKYLPALTSGLFLAATVATCEL
jgi:hypothetical protein